MLKCCDNSSLTVVDGTRRSVIIRPCDQSIKGRLIHGMTRPRDVSFKGRIVQGRIIQEVCRDTLVREKLFMSTCYWDVQETESKVESSTSMEKNSRNDHVYIYVLSNVYFLASAYAFAVLFPWTCAM
jgi:hypothetical protein